MTDIKVPELGESISEGTIAKWIVSEGDTVQNGELLAELETDKVNLEINAEESGVITSIVKQEGDTVTVGEVIAQLGEASEAESAESQEKQSKADSPAAENAAEKNQQPQQKEQSKQKEDLNDTDAQPGKAPLMNATPAARKLARERGIDIQELSRQNPAERLSVEQVKQIDTQKPASKAPDTKHSSKSGSGASTGSAPSEGNNDSDRMERIPMSRRRQTIAKRLVDAQHNAAMLTTFNEIDMSAVMNLRKRRKQSFLDQNDVKLGFMSFFTKAVVGALKKFPLLNAEIDGTDILQKKYYDVGIAVSTDQGLVVPVVRDADRLGFAQIEKEISEFAKKARDNKLSLKDLQGGSFTITNGGTFGSLLSTPILNAPQVGILGMHTIQTRPVAIDEERMENRPMMYVALSYDHRIVDGAEAVQFLVAVKKMIEDPETLLLEG